MGFLHLIPSTFGGVARYFSLLLSCSKISWIECLGFSFRCFHISFFSFDFLYLFLCIYLHCTFTSLVYLHFHVFTFMVWWKGFLHPLYFLFHIFFCFPLLYLAYLHSLHIYIPCTFTFLVYLLFLVPFYGVMEEIPPLSFICLCKFSWIFFFFPCPLVHICKPLGFSN